MLKAVCTQTEFEALSEAEKSHYQQEGPLHFLQAAGVTIEGVRQGDLQPVAQGPEQGDSGACIG